MLTVTNKKGKKVLVYLSVTAAISLVVGAIGFVYPPKQLPTIHTSTVAVKKGGTITRNSRESSESVFGNIQAGARESIVYTSEANPVDTAANAAVLTWEQSGSRGVRVEVRTHNGSKWSDWTELSNIDGGKDGTDKPGLASSLVLAKKITELQYRVYLNGSAIEPSSTFNVSNTHLSAIDSSKGPDGSTSLSSRLFPSASAASSEPAVISRKDWGCPEPNWSTWPPEYARLGRVIVHHTATTESGNSFADVRAIWQYHAVNLGWGDIGYHYIVDHAGRIFEGRYHDRTYTKSRYVEVIGGHAYDNNRGTIGISVIGNYTNETPTVASLNSVASLIGYNLARYRIDPSGDGPFGQAVVGHYQVYSTSCPGESIRSRLGDVRAVATRVYKSLMPTLPVSLDSQRWMQLSRDTTKVSLSDWSPQPVTLPAGKQLFISDKVYHNGMWYFRTQWDAGIDNQYGIPQTAFSEISPIPLDVPRWMQLAEPAEIVDPMTEKVVGTSQPSAGSQYKFTSKVLVNGVWYFRSEADTLNNKPYYIIAKSIQDVPYIPLDSPRWMTIKRDTTEIDAARGSRGASIIKGTQLRITTKIFVNNAWYFRSEQQTTDQQPLAIPATDMGEVSYSDISTGPKWMVLSKDARKLNPRTGVEAIDTYNVGRQVLFGQTISVNGALYYRTNWDKNNETDLAFPADSISEIRFQPLEAPVTITPKSPIALYDPRDGRIVGHIGADSPITFTSTIDISGTIYFRTNADTVAQIYSAALKSDVAP